MRCEWKLTKASIRCESLPPLHRMPCSRVSASRGVGLSDDHLHGSPPSANAGGVPGTDVRGAKAVQEEHGTRVHRRPREEAGRLVFGGRASEAAVVWVEVDRSLVMGCEGWDGPAVVCFSCGCLPFPYSCVCCSSPLWKEPSPYLFVKQEFSSVTRPWHP